LAFQQVTSASLAEIAGEKQDAHPVTADESALVNWVARYDFGRGAYASAQTLYEHKFDFRRRVLGREHPDTSTSAWKPFRTLQDSGEFAAALAVLKRDLLWLLNRDAAILGADQRTVRQYVAQAIKKKGWSGCLLFMPPRGVAASGLLHPCRLVSTNELRRQSNRWTSDGTRLFPIPLLRLERSTVGTRRLSMLGPSILDKLREQDKKNGA
jgi:hypothetical protein